MTSHDLTADEMVLRDRLHAQLIPPATPERLAYAIDRLAEDEIARGAEGVWARLSDAGRSRFLRVAIALVAIIAIAGSTLLLGASIRQRTPVAATPIPTLPAITQPSLPPAAAKPTDVRSGRWFDATSAFVVSALGIVETVDGGQTWQRTGDFQSTFGSGGDMLDLQHGYEGGVQKTVDGKLELVVSTSSDRGFSWSNHVVADIASPEFGDSASVVHFTDPSHGVALATTMSPYPTGSAPPVFCDAFGTNGKGETCDVIPLVCAGFSTDDGGATWAVLDSPPCVTAAGVRWYSPTIGTVANFDGSMTTTVDGGRTWHRATVPGVVPGSTFLGGPTLMTTVSGTTLRMAGSLFIDGGTTQPITVWESPDAGASWRVAYTADWPSVSGTTAPRDVPAPANLSDLWAFDADHWIGIVSVDAGSIAAGGMVETWDGGRSWHQVATLDITADGGTWHWADRLHGMTGGGRWVYKGDGSWTMEGTWLMTNDGGQTWHDVPF